MRHLLLCSTILIALGCDGATTPDEDAGPMGTDAGAIDAAVPPSLPSSIGPAERPAQLVVPAAHDGTTPLPLVVLLHGYSASGGAQDLYLGFSRATRANGFYLVIPDGTVDTSGNRFWNATPACCNFGGVDVDDVAYLTGLVDEVEAMAPVRDVYFFGHSNGGFMSYRMACELADRVTAIGSLAGSDFANETDCEPSQPVSVLQIHGRVDETIAYDGQVGAYPSAPDDVARWASRAGCDDVVTPGDALDLDMGLAGAETVVEARDTGCTGADAALWTIEGGGHIPAVSRDFSTRVLTWLDAHRR
ncbi:MAG: hypothetical protein H6719_33040 [Sandaracinaceae bacterium]|nr:hypothetical protein [Sandaracinaceae bacterium]